MLGLLILFILFLAIWRSLGLHHNSYTPHKESKWKKKHRLEREEKEKLSIIKKYYVHPYGDRIEAIREPLFNTNTFTIISLNDELFVVGNTLMMPCKDILEAEKCQYRNIIEYSYQKHLKNK